MKKLQSYEESLLHNYQLYLSLLADIIHGWCWDIIDISLEHRINNEIGLASDRANHKANGLLQLTDGTQIPMDAVQV